MLFQIEGRNRRKQFAAVSDRGHADADQVVGRQLRKHFAKNSRIIGCCGFSRSITARLLSAAVFEKGRSDSKGVS